MLGSKLYVGQLRYSISSRQLKRLFEDYGQVISAEVVEGKGWGFGLGDSRDYSLQEIGRKLGITRERIRQIESKALQKFRQECDDKNLKDYLTI